MKKLFVSVISVIIVFFALTVNAPHAQSQTSAGIAMAIEQKKAERAVTVGEYYSHRTKIENLLILLTVAERLVSRAQRAQTDTLMNKDIWAPEFQLFVDALTRAEAIKKKVKIQLQNAEKDLTQVFEARAQKIGREILLLELEQTAAEIEKALEK